MPSWSQKIEARNFPADFCARNSLGQDEPLCRHSIDCCFVSRSSWHNQVSSMVTNRPRQDIICIVPKKFQNLLRRLAPLTFLIRDQAFWDPLRGELPHVQILMNYGPNPLTWDAQLLNYWFRSRSLSPKAAGISRSFSFSKLIFKLNCNEWVIWI